jgi:hypothetical protein
MRLGGSGIRLVTVGRLILLLRVVAHFDVLVAIATVFLLEFIIVIVTFILNVLTLGVGDIFLLFVLATAGLGAFHFVVFVLIILLLGLGEFAFQGGLQLCFFRTVGATIVVQVIGLWLVWRVFRRGGFFRIPVQAAVLAGEWTMNR